MSGPGLSENDQLWKVAAIFVFQARGRFRGDRYRRGVASVYSDVRRICSVFEVTSICRLWPIEGDCVFKRQRCFGEGLDIDSWAHPGHRTCLASMSYEAVALARSVALRRRIVATHANYEGAVGRHIDDECSLSA